MLYVVFVITRMASWSHEHFPYALKTAKNCLLGKGAKNQNGNLRWHLPWRGGGLEGVSFAIKLFWKMIFLKTI